MRIYYHDNKPVSPAHPPLLSAPHTTKTDNTQYKGDCRLPHDSNIALTPTHLTSLGILHYTFPPSSTSSPSNLDALAKSRNYANRDEITVSRGAMGAAYEEKIKMFYDEHMHEDEEIRYILKGAGFFDVRDAEERWVRVGVGSGDLLVLPAGIYQRFTVDEGNVGGVLDGVVVA